MTEFKRGFKRRPKGLNDAWVWNPPDTCQMRRFILRGERCCDIAICAYKCINQCDVFYKHEDETKRLKREKAKILVLEREIKNRREREFFDKTNKPKREDIPVEKETTKFVRRN